LRPWYFVLGANQSGKHSLLKNTVNPLDIAPSDNIVNEQNIALNIQCLLTDNAVLFVPNGDLLTQPANQA
ncbi:hypothetical protein ACWWKA_40120, partial [Klebsiella quasipneumoniae]